MNDGSFTETLKVILFLQGIVGALNYTRVNVTRSTQQAAPSQFRKCAYFSSDSFPVSSLLIFILVI